MKRRDFLKIAAVTVPTVSLASMTDISAVATDDEAIESWMNRLPCKDDQLFGNTRGWLSTRVGFAQALLHPFSLCHDRGTVLQNEHWTCVRDMVFDAPVDVMPEGWLRTPAWDDEIPHRVQDEMSERITRIIGEGLVYPGAKIVLISRTRWKKGGELVKSPFIEFKLTVVFPRKVLAGTLFDEVEILRKG